MTEPTLDNVKFSRSSFFLKIQNGFKEIKKDPHMIKLSIYYTIIATITWLIIANMMQPYAKDFGYTEAEMGILFSLLYLGYTIINFIIVYFKDKITKKMFYLSIPFVIGIPLIFSTVVSKELAPLIILIVMIPNGIKYSFLDKFVNEEFPSNVRATAMSSLNMLYNISFVVLNFLAGIVQDNFNTKLVFFSLGVISLLVAFPLSVLLVRESKYK